MSLHAKEAHPGWHRRRHWFMPRPHRLLQACLYFVKPSMTQLCAVVRGEPAS